MKFKLISLSILVIIASSSKAQFGLGTNSPNANAKLEIVSANRGLLLPRVNLTSKTMDLNADGDNNISNQPIGLLVYNTGNTLVKGFCYWNGSEWQNVVNASSELATATLNCSAATLDPQQLILNPTAIIAGTTMEVPYTSGNGGNFTGITLQSVGNSNVTATISDGKLNVGSGFLTFNIAGIPSSTQNTPTGISFDLTPFKTANAGISLSPSNGIVTIGKQKEAKISIATIIAFPWGSWDGFSASISEVSLTTPDKKYALRVAINAGDQLKDAYVQIKSVGSTSRTIMWNHLGSYGSNYVTGASAGKQDLYNAWSGGNGIGSFLQTQDPWADPGIVQAANGGPEYRYYAWMTHGSSEKTAYIATIMAGAIDGNISSTNQRNLKVFIKIEQIVAL
jgi:hypothetical protein